MGPPCTQLVDTEPGVVRGQEDCLYLNVNIPQTVSIVTTKSEWCTIDTC